MSILKGAADDKIRTKIMLPVIALTLCYGTIVEAVILWELPEKLDYVDHHCERDCLASSGPRLCEYNFTVEHYQTLARACYKCPHTRVDCYRPHCVPGDGARRAIKVVNRMMPGPGIHVCKGDTILVNVYNELHDYEGTAIHWHGLLQKGSPHMDGVPMITQCPISAHSMFQYRFTVGEPGTHYWHSHSGLQRGDGVYGAIVVRDTNTTNNMRLYDLDLPEHTIIVQDWSDQFTTSKYSMHHHSGASGVASSILINGFATSFGSQGVASHSSHGMMGDVTTSSSNTTQHGGGAGHGDDIAYVPHAVFSVLQGKRYRFRLISNGVVNCPLKVSVEKHKLTLIASDGLDINPTEVDSLVIFAGERYDFVLRANQAMGNYWIHVIALGGCTRMKVSQTAILRYHGAMDLEPHTGQTYDDGDRQGLIGNPFHFSGAYETVGTMTSDHPTDAIMTSQNVKKFYLTMDFNNVENDISLHPEYYPLRDFASPQNKDSHLYALQINHITNTMPWSPLISQLGEIPEDIFCNETSLKKDCHVEFCRCLHRLKVSLNDVVELVMISEGKNGLGYHPMHLHGHSFHVLGLQNLNTTITRDEVELMDRRGQLKRNSQNPIKKDTVMVPDGGYAIVRFKADNPGFWFFHCHVDFHLAMGMSLVLQVGEPHEMTQTPRNFPRCGNWRYVEECDRYSEFCSAMNRTTFSLCVILIAIFIQLVYI